MNRVSTGGGLGETRLIASLRVTGWVQNSRLEKIRMAIASSSTV